jgi:hypothetical protein
MIKEVNNLMSVCGSMDFDKIGGVCDALFNAAEYQRGRENGILDKRKYPESKLTSEKLKEYGYTDAHIKGYFSVKR